MTTTAAGIIFSPMNSVLHDISMHLEHALPLCVTKTVPRISENAYNRLPETLQNIPTDLIVTTPLFFSRNLQFLRWYYIIEVLKISLQKKNNLTAHYIYLCTMKIVVDATTVSFKHLDGQDNDQQHPRTSWNAYVALTISHYSNSCGRMRFRTHEQLHSIKKSVQYYTLTWQWLRRTINFYSHRYDKWYLH